MVNIQKLKGAITVSTSPVTIYENLNFAEHRGFLFFTNFASGDAFTYTIEVIDTQAAAYAVISSKSVDYTKLQSFAEKGIELVPRIADQFRIKMFKTGGLDRTVNYTMYAILVT